MSRRPRGPGHGKSDFYPSAQVENNPPRGGRRPAIAEAEFL